MPFSVAMSSVCFYSPEKFLEKLRIWVPDALNMSILLTRSLHSEIALSSNHQVQEHASSRRGHEGHGPEVDVQHLVVFSVLFRTTASL